MKCNLCNSHMAKNELRGGDTMYECYNIKCNNKMVGEPWIDEDTQCSCGETTKHGRLCGECMAEHGDYLRKAEKENG